MRSDGGVQGVTRRNWTCGKLNDDAMLSATVMPSVGEGNACTTIVIGRWKINPGVTGHRDGEAAMFFMDNLAKRLAHRVQLTTDGNNAYLDAIDGAFGGDIDYAMLIKIYGPASEGPRRYSPAECIGCEKPAMIGNRNPKHISAPATWNDRTSPRENADAPLHSPRMRPRKDREPHRGNCFARHAGQL